GISIIKIVPRLAEETCPFIFGIKTIHAIGYRRVLQVPQRRVGKAPSFSASKLPIGKLIFITQNAGYRMQVVELVVEVEIGIGVGIDQSTVAVIGPTSIAGKSRNGRRTVVFILIVGEVKPRKARHPEPWQYLIRQLDVGDGLVGRSPTQFLVNPLNNIITQQMGVRIGGKIPLFIIYGQIGSS